MADYTFLLPLSPNFQSVMVITTKLVPAAMRTYVANQCNPLDYILDRLSARLWQHAWYGHVASLM